MSLPPDFLRLSASIALAVAVLSSCMFGPPHIKLAGGVASNEDIWASSLISYGVDTDFRTRNGVTRYHVVSLGGKTRLPVRRYEVVCVYEHNGTRVRILDVGDASDETCPDNTNPAEILDTARDVTGRPLEVDLYFDREARYYHRHEGRIASKSSPINLAVSFTDKVSFHQTLTALLHETFHIQAKLTELELALIDEELNAELFGICLTVPSADRRYLSHLLASAHTGLENIKVSGGGPGTAGQTAQTLPLDHVLREFIEYKERYKASGDDEGTQNTQFIYYYLPSLIFRHLTEGSPETMNKSGFLSFCDAMSSRQFSAPVLMNEIEAVGAAEPR